MDLHWADLRGQFQGRDLDDVADIELTDIIGYVVKRGPGNPNMRLTMYLGRSGADSVSFEVIETED